MKKVQCDIRQRLRYYEGRMRTSKRTWMPLISSETMFVSLTTIRAWRVITQRLAMRTICLRKGWRSWKESSSRFWTITGLSSLAAFERFIIYDKHLKNIYIFYWIAANLLNPIVLSIAFQVHWDRRRPHLGGVGVPLLQMLTQKNTEGRILPRNPQKLQSILRQLLYPPRSFHCYTIYLDRWFKLDISNNFLTFTRMCSHTSIIIFLILSSRFTKYLR